LKKKSRILNFLFLSFSILGFVISLTTLFALIYDLIQSGGSRLSYQFLSSFPSRFPDQAGILSAWVGTLLVMLVTACVAIPIGVGAGIYLEEYAPKNFITSFIEINISNLAGVPSIVFGLMALGLFVYKISLGQSILTAGLTLALLILPIVIVTTREAIRTIPTGIRHSVYALGATKWQLIRDHIIPYSTGGISTGVIIGLSRAIGETAPLITIGALTFIAFLPHALFVSHFPFVSLQWIMDPFTVLPIQMFNWTSRPQAEFHQNAAAAGLVLMSITMLLNLIAIIVRVRFRKKIKW
jgi:phosphate transport system permease protein